MKKKSTHLSISQTAKTLGVSQETLRRWEKAGKISAVRLDGKNRSFAKKDIETLKAAMPLSISEAAKKLGISIHALRRLADKGLIKEHRNERHERVFDLKEIENYAQTINLRKKTIKERYSPQPKTEQPEPEVLTIPVYSPLDMASIKVHDVRTFPITALSEPETPEQTTFADIVTTTEQEKTTPPDSFARERLSQYFPVNKIRIIATISAAVFLLTFLPLVTIDRLKSPSLPVEASQGRQVLAASTQQLLGKLSINLPVTFTNDVNFQGNLTAGSLSLFQNGLTVQEGNIQVTEGTVTAPNLIYSVTGGDGVTVTGGQNPVISFSGVTSLGGQTGAVSLAAGDGITIDGTKITNNDKGSSQNIFKNIVVGSDTIAADSNDDSFTFVAGTGITLTADIPNKQLTITSIGGGGTSSQWTTSGNDIFYTLGKVGVGTSTPGNTLDVLGTAHISGALNLGSTLVANGTITGTTLNGTTGLNTGAGAGTLRIDASGNLSNIGTTELNGLTYTWPGSGGSSNYVLTTNGSGTLAWKAVSGAGGAGAGTLTAIGDVSSGDAFTSSGTQGATLYFADSGFHGALGIGTLTGDQTYTLPNESGTLCLTSGNCAGAGGGITGSGSSNFFALFDTSGTLTSSSIFDNGNIGIGTTNPGSFRLQVAGSIGPDATDTYDLGSSSNEFNNIYGKNIYASGDLVVTGNITSTGGSVGFWQRNDGVVAPVNTTDDLVIGGSATSSALVQFSGTPTTSGTGAQFTFNNLTSGTGVGISSTPTNSTSGNLLALSQNGTIATTNTTVSSSLLNITRNFTSQTAQNLPVFDASSHGGRVYASNNPISWSHTVGTGDNRLLIVTVNGYYGNYAPYLPTGAMYNGIAMTRLTSKTFNGNDNFLYVYYLLNPPSGTHTVTITTGTNSNNTQVGGATSWSNVDQSSPFGTPVSASGSSTNPSVTASTVSTQVVVDALAKDGGYPYTQSISAGSGQTSYWTDTGSFGYDGGGMSSKGVSGASTTMSWTLSPSMLWGLIAIPINSNPTGNPLAISGSLAALTSNCAIDTGYACVDTANILSLNQNFAGSTGDVLSISGAGKGNLATFDTTNSSANGLSIDLASSSSNQYALKLTGNNGSTDILYVGADGNIGIGTTTPGSALDLNNGTVSNANEYTIADTGQGEGYCFTSTSQCMSIYTTGQGGFNGYTFDTISGYPYVFKGGNVGIGTTNPSQLLHVYDSSGDSVALSESGAATHYAMFSTKGTGRTYNFGVGGASETTFGVPNKFFVFDATVGAMRMVIDTNGNMGIGTAAPASLFSVGASSQFQVNGSGQLYLADSTAPGTTTNMLYASGGNLYWNGTQLGAPTSAGLFQENLGALSPNNITDDLLLGATSTSSALVKLGGTSGSDTFFNTGGNFGIGTKTPQYSFDLLSQNATQLRLGYDTSNYYTQSISSTGGVTFDAVGSGAGFTFSDDLTLSSGNLFLGSQGSTNGVLTFYSAGGATAPSISADSSKNLNISAPSGQVVLNGTGNIVLDPSSSNLIANLSSTGDFLVQQAGTPFAMFSHTGNVGIGTTDPQFPFDVATTVDSNQSYGFLNPSGTTGTATGTNSYSIRASGRVMAPEFNAVSDERLKNVQFDLSPDVALNAISQLQPVSFTWKSNPTGQPILGFLAQDVEHVIPNAVSQIATANFPDQRELDYNQLIAVTVGAVQQLNTNYTNLNQRINTLSSSSASTNANDTVSAVTDTIHSNTALIASLSASLDVVKGQLATLQDLNLTPLLASDSADTTITTINNDLLVMGTTSLNDVSTTSLTIGNTLKLDGTSINSLGTTLAIEPLKQANIEFMGGEVSIKTDGTLTVNQNATFNKDVAVKGTLSAEHLTVNQHDITDLSDTESIASASAGVVTLTAGQTMRKVDTPFVHKNSLILLTPENSTHGQTPYTTEKKDGESFLIKIDQPINTNITLDFLIVGEK